MNRYMTIVSRGSANADANADDNVREGTCGGNQSPKTLSFCQKLGSLRLALIIFGRQLLMSKTMLLMMMMVLDKTIVVAP